MNGYCNKNRNWRFRNCFSRSSSKTAEATGDLIGNKIADKIAEKIAGNEGQEIYIPLKKGSKLLMT